MRDLTGARRFGHRPVVFWLGMRLVGAQGGAWVAGQATLSTTWSCSGAGGGRWVLKVGCWVAGLATLGTT